VKTTAKPAPEDSDEEDDSEQGEEDEVEEINDDDFIEVIEEVGETTKDVGHGEENGDSRSPPQQKRQVFVYKEVFLSCLKNTVGISDWVD